MPGLNPCFLEQVIELVLFLFISPLGVQNSCAISDLAITGADSASSSCNCVVDFCANLFYILLPAIIGIRSFFTNAMHMTSCYRYLSHVHSGFYFSLPALMILPSD